MNQDSKENLWLVDHLHKCRCCFERFDHNENQFKITEIIEEQFLELTQIELKTTPNFSNTICSKCASELQSISNFRLNLITKQQQLYDFVVTSYKIQDDIKFEPVNIKTETQTSDDFDSMFHFGSSFEEIKVPEFPLTSKATEVKTTGNSLHQPKILVSKVQTKVQKKKKTNLKKEVQIKAQTEVKTKEVQYQQVKPILNKQMCPHCGLFLKGAGTLSKHIRRVHLKLKYFFCDLCDYGSIFRSGIVKHMYTHTMREKLCCNKCKFETISKDLMKTHLNNDHKVKTLDQISECYCGKVFPSIEKLNYHKRTHKKNHICTICSKAFSAPNRLKRHFMVNHSGIVRKREKACDACGKMFETLKHLRSHMIHHKDPQFICTFDGCTKKCFTQVALESHKKTHIDQRDYACQLCDKKYFAANHLSRHVKNFHRQLKVSCELPGCSSKFARKETYRNHVLSHHKDLSQEKVQALLKKIREFKQE